MLCRAGVAQAAAALLGAASTARRRLSAWTAAPRRCSATSARCSSYSVSAQSSALPGASPTSDEPSATGCAALVALPAAPGAMPASDGAKTAAAELPRRCSAANDAATMSAAARPSGSGHLLEDALRAACRLNEAAQRGRVDTIAGPGGMAAAVGVTCSGTAPVRDTGWLRESVSKPLDGAVAAAELTAGVPSETAGQAAARSQRAHVLRPINNVQSPLNGEGQLPVSPFGRAAMNGSLSSWRPIQSPTSPYVSTHPPSHPDTCACKSWCPLV